jgi:prepilin signal peptidase PulO-like enzyme (type II secretory pathway)
LILLIRMRSYQAEDKTPWATWALPFGSFLCLAGIFTLFWGESTLKWYLQLYR